MDGWMGEEEVKMKTNMELHGGALAGATGDAWKKWRLD
jgi:hypothetical protein